jgi:hypothetical protein
VRLLAGLFTLMVASLALSEELPSPSPEPSASPSPEGANEFPVSMYAGRMLSVDQDQLGALHRGADLWALRLVGSLELPLGIRLGARGDLTSLSQIDPESLDVTSLRSAEGYVSLSWSRRLAGLEVGPALALGALIPVESGAQWVYQGLFAGGARIGRGRSWAYLMAGSDGAADAASLTSGGVRFIGAASIEFRRFAAVADWVSGSGGRKRAGVLFRIPTP